MKKKLYTEEDIQKTIWFLKTNHPEIPAIREEAIKVLSGMQSFSETFVEVMNKIKKIKLPENSK
ncbi:hypothetical protein HY025_02200 [Candidatus Daviesbacteria bacterium]|nr:hypothetical protein [Candidatus Daviesbacteria bacterium]